MFYKFVIGYLRLSRDDEDRQDESNSIKNQRILIQQFIKNREEFQKSKVVFFVDDGFSGSSFNRPELKKMMELVKKEKDCCIIVKDLSRFGRNTIDCQNYLEKIFPFLHVRFIAVNDFYDSEDVISARKDTEVKFKNLVNGIYPQICSENIKQVMRKQAELGKYHGSVPPFGYQFPEDCRSRLLVDNETSETVRFIFKRYLEGKTSTEIAKELNEKQIPTPTQYFRRLGYRRNLEVSPMWTYSMVTAIVINPVYTGTVANHKTENRIVSVKSAIKIPRKDWICVPDMHTAIISQEEFEKALEIYQERAKARRCTEVREKKSAADAPVLNGKIRCGHCRRKVRIRAEARNKTVKFYCSSVNVGTGLGCYESGVPMAKLERLILELIRKQASLAEDVTKAARQMNQTVDTHILQRQQKEWMGKIECCRREKRMLYERYVAEELDQKQYLEKKKEMNQTEEKYRDKIEEIQEKLAQNSRQKEQSRELEKITGYVNLEKLSVPIVQELIDVIYFYDPEHIEVVWKFRDEWLKGAGEKL